MKRFAATAVALLLAALVAHVGSYLFVWGPDYVGYRWFMLTHHGEGPDAFDHVTFRYCDSAGTYTFGYKEADGSSATDVLKHATRTCKEAGLLP